MTASKEDAQGQYARARMKNQSTQHASSDQNMSVTNRSIAAVWMESACGKKQQISGTA
jgi:hypothetical protein